MKTIGLIGGMSPESTVSYYQQINAGVNRELGGFHSAKIILYSVDFAQVEDCQRRGEWAKAGEILANAARALQAAGADYILLCTNTMHKVASAIQAAVSVPFVHIADVTAGAILADGRRTAGLLGTRYTTEDSFMVDRLQSQGLRVLLPTPAERTRTNDIIFGELCKGVVTDLSKRYYLGVIDRLAAEGAECVILGCTEIGLLVGPGDTRVPLYDTAALHAAKAVELALGSSDWPPHRIGEDVP